MISGDVLKYRKGLFIRECYENAIFGSSEFPLTLPDAAFLNSKHAHDDADNNHTDDVADNV